jgi:hypothetical protein
MREYEVLEMTEKLPMPSRMTADARLSLYKAWFEQATAGHDGRDTDLVNLPPDWPAAEPLPACDLGLGRIVALHYRSSTSDKIR